MREFLIDDMISIPSELIINFKKINLNEQQLIVLLQIFALSKKNITPKVKTLSKNLTISEEEISDIIRDLTVNEFIETIMTNQGYKISLEKTYNKIYAIKSNHDLNRLIVGKLNRELNDSEKELCDKWKISGINQELITKYVDQYLNQDNILEKIDAIVGAQEKSTKIIVNEKNKLFE